MPQDRKGRDLPPRSLGSIERSESSSPYSLNAIRIHPRRVGILGAILLAIALIAYISHLSSLPPNLSKMSDANLSRMVKKCRTSLSSSPGVIVGRYGDNVMETLLYPLDGGEPILIDSTDDYGSTGIRSYYEPTFDYIRMDEKKLSPLDAAMGFFSELYSRVILGSGNSGGSMLGYAGYLAGSNYDTVERFIINLDDFNIQKGADLGVGIDPPFYTKKHRLIPTPSGSKNFFLTDFDPNKTNMQLGVIPRSEDGSYSFPAHSGSIAISPPELKSGLPEIEWYWYNHVLQSAEDGLYISYYRIYPSLRYGEEASPLPFQSGIAKIGLDPDPYYEIIEDIVVEGDKYHPLSSRGFNIAYYFEEAKKIIGTITFRYGNEFLGVLATWNMETKEFEPISYPAPINPLMLADYENKLIIYFTSYEQSPISTFDDLPSVDGEQELSGVLLGTRSQSAGYHLMKLDLESLELTKIRTVGSSSSGSPAFTLYEPGRQIITADRGSLILLDYDGNLVRTLESDDEASWSMFYAAYQVTES